MLHKCDQSYNATMRRILRDWKLQVLGCTALNITKTILLSEKHVRDELQRNRSSEMYCYWASAHAHG